MISSKKLMFPCPNHMFGAQISTPVFITTKTYFVCASLFAKALKNIRYLLLRVLAPSFSFFPHIGMVLFQMLTLTFQKLKILYTVVSFYVILMVDTFFFKEFPTQKKLHYVTMVQYSLPINVYSQVTKCRKTRSTLFQIVPIFAYVIVVFVLMPPSSVHWAHLTVGHFENSGTVFNSTNFTSCHNVIVA